MQAKQDKFLQEKLDSMCEIPEGFRFNSMPVWNALEQQLQPAAKRTKYRYAAAACLAVITAVYLLLPGKEIEPALTPVADKSGTEINLVAEPVAPLVKVNKKTLQISKKAGVKERIAPSKKEETIIASTIVLPGAPQQIAITAPSPIIILPIKQTTAQKTKPLVKRYRIVHLDELYASPPPAFTAQLEERKPFFSVPEKELEKTKPILTPEPNAGRVFGFRTRPQTNTITTDH